MLKYCYENLLTPAPDDYMAQVTDNMGAQTRKSWVHSPTQHGHISPCVFIACPTGLGHIVIPEPPPS